MSLRSAGKYRVYMNVGYVLTEEQLRRYFSQFGEVLDVYLPKHNSGRNKGFGFTTFETEVQLLAALQSSEHVIDGVVVRINRAGPRPEYDQSRREEASEDAVPRSPTQLPVQAHGKGPRLYVGGISEEVTEDEIKAHFSKWGTVVDIYFPGKKGQKRVNYCFVTFDNWRAAQRACNQSERSVAGRPLQSISIAEERHIEAARATPPYGALPQYGSSRYFGDLRAYPGTMQTLASTLEALQGGSGLTGAAAAAGLTPHQIQTAQLLAASGIPIQGNPLVSSLQTGAPSGVEEQLMLGAAGRASEMGGMLQGGMGATGAFLLQPQMGDNTMGMGTSGRPSEAGGQGEVSPFGRSYGSVGNLAGLPGGGQGYGWGRMDPSYAGTYYRGYAAPGGAQMTQHSGYDAQGNYIGQQTTEGAFGSAALQDYYQGRRNLSMHPPPQ